MADTVTFGSADNVRGGLSLADATLLQIALDQRDGLPLEEWGTSLGGRRSSPQEQLEFLNANRERAAALVARLDQNQAASNGAWAAANNVTVGPTQDEVDRRAQADRVSAVLDQWRTSNDATRAARLAALRNTFGQGGPQDPIGSQEFGYLLGLEVSSPTMKQVMLDPWYTSSDANYGGTPTPAFTAKLAAAQAAAKPFVAPAPGPASYLGKDGKLYGNLTDAMNALPIPTTPPNARPSPYEGANVNTIAVGPTNFVPGDFATNAAGASGVSTQPVLIASPLVAAAPGARDASHSGIVMAILALVVAGFAFA